MLTNLALLTLVWLMAQALWKDQSSATGLVLLIILVWLAASGVVSLVRFLSEAVT